MNNLKNRLSKILEIILNSSIYEWMLGLAFALYIVWYHQIENLLQHTLIDHVVSYLPAICQMLVGNQMLPSVLSWL